MKSQQTNLKAEVVKGYCHSLILVISRGDFIWNDWLITGILHEEILTVVIRSLQVFRWGDVNCNDWLITGIQVRWWRLTNSWINGRWSLTSTRRTNMTSGECRHSHIISHTDWCFYWYDSIQVFMYHTLGDMKQIAHFFPWLVCVSSALPQF